MIKTVKKSIFIFFLLGVFSLARCSSRDDGLPSKLGELNLSRVVQGREAAALVNKMHGKEVGSSLDLIGYYGKIHTRNILFVSAFETAEKAKADLMKMAVKMAQGTKVFAPLTYDKMGDHVHFKTRGLGFAHYFFRVDNILVWWQVEPAKAEATYAALLAFDFSALREKAQTTP